MAKYAQKEADGFFAVQEVSGSVKLRLRLECSQSDGNQKDENIKEKDSLIVTALSGHVRTSIYILVVMDRYLTFPVLFCHFRIDSR